MLPGLDAASSHYSSRALRPGSPAWLGPCRGEPLPLNLWKPLISKPVKQG